MIIIAVLLPMQVMLVSANTAGGTSSPQYAILKKNNEQIVMKQGKPLLMTKMVRLQHKRHTRHTYGCIRAPINGHESTESGVMASYSQIKSR